MKIKKKFQGTIPENKILDTPSSSKTDTYSCNMINQKFTQGIEEFEGMWDGVYERLLATVTFHAVYQRDVLVLAIGHSGASSSDQTGIAIICPACGNSTTDASLQYCQITGMGDLTADDFRIEKTGNKINIYFKKNNHYRTYFAFCLAKTANITLH